jgi:hypothetical protein
MQPVPSGARQRQHPGGPSDVRSALSTDLLYLPWRDDRWRQAEVDLEAKPVGQPSRPSVVQVSASEQLPAQRRGAQPHREAKTFAELQQILIRSELVREAVGTEVRTKRGA